MSSDAAASSNPFPGLRPFRSDEKHLFFGREDQTGELLERLRESRFLAVVGPSGSGKSSLVRAGLLPELYGGTMTSAGSHWEVVVMRPGGDPLTNLAAAMVEADLYDGDAPGIVDQVRTTLDRSARGLVETVRQSDGVVDGTNMLVVVDQFEELFRFRGQGGQSLEEASAFVKLLLEASRTEAPPIYVVLTMRSDYLGECAQFRGLAEAVNEGEYLIPRLTRSQRRSAIEGPVRVGGAEISKRLLTKLLNDVGDDPDQLPVLQHALMRTWSCWERDREADEPIDLRHYEATGGMQEALSRHADEVHASLPSERQREVAERLFRALTERIDQTRGIRRPLQLGRLADVTGASIDELRAVVETFRARGCTFLMPPAPRELTPRTVIDISHESLMRVWQRLRRWVDEEAQSAGIYRRLDETARLHAEGRAGLYHDPDLQIALSWREEDHPTEAWAALYGGDYATAMAFLDRSREEAAREEREREAARQRELEQAQALAASQARSARLMRRFALTVCAALLVAIGLATWAIRQSWIAQEATVEARAEQGKTWLANARTLEEAKNFFAARLKAARAVGFEGFGRDKFSAEQAEDYKVLLQPDLPEWSEARTLISDAAAYVPLWQSGAEPQHAGRDDAVNDAAVSPLGSIIVTAPEMDNVLHVWDAKSGAHLGSVDDVPDDIEALAFSPDGSVLAGGLDRTVILWDVRGHDLTRRTRREFEDGDIRALAFSRDGERLAIGDDFGALFEWTIASDELSEPIVLHGGRRIADLEYSPDGSLLASAGWDGTVELLEAAPLAGVATLVSPTVQPPSTSGDPARAFSVSFSPDGQRLAVGGERIPVNVWNAATREPVVTLLEEEWNAIARNANGAFRTGARSMTSNVAFAPDGKSLAVTWNGTQEMYDVAIRPTLTVFDVEGEKLDRPGRVRELTAPSGTVIEVHFTQDSRRVFTGDMGGWAWLWDLERGEPVGGPPASHTTLVDEVVFSRDGRLFASGDRHGAIRVWDATSGRFVATMQGHDGRIEDLCFNLRGDRLFSVGFNDRTFRAWEVPTGAPLSVETHDAVVTSVDLSPDGSTVAVGGWRNEVVFYDAAALSERGTLRIEHGINFLRYLSSGNRIVTASSSSDGSEHRISVYEIGIGETGTRVGYAGDRSLDDWVRGLDVTPDGSRIVAGSSDGQVKIWEVSSGGSLLESAASQLPRHEGLRSLAVSADGERVATADAAGAVRVFSLRDGSLIALLPTTFARNLAFSPDDSLLVTGGDAGLLQAWSAKDDRVRCQIDVPGDRSPDHWTRRGPGAVRFEPLTGRLVVAGGLADDPQIVARWDLDGPVPLRAPDLGGHASSPRALAVSADGTRLASAFEDVFVWDLRTGEGVKVASYPESLVQSLAFTRDGATLAVGLGAATGSRPSVRVLDVTRGGRPIGDPLPLRSAIFGMTFSPDGRRLFTAGDATIPIWAIDPRSRAVTRDGSLAGDVEFTRSVAISADGRVLASAGGANVKVWDLETLEQLGPTLELGSWTFRTALSPDGKLVACGGGHNRLRLWDATGSGRLIADLLDGSGAVYQFVTDVTFSADGELLAATRSDGSATVWNVTAFERTAELAVYADAVDLEQASGGIAWTLRAQSLGPGDAPRMFLPLTESYLPFLARELSAAEALEELFAHYLDVGNYRAAESVLAGAEGPPASTEQWARLAEAALREARRRISTGMPEAARPLLGLTRRLAEAHELSPATRLGILTAGGSWRAAFEYLVESRAGLDGVERVALLERFFTELRERLEGLERQDPEDLDVASLPDARLVLASAVKLVVDKALASWESTLDRTELVELPAVRLLERPARETGAVLVGKGATWRYFPENAAPDPAWKDPGFDDAAWPAGSAGLGFAGGGTRAEEVAAIATTLDAYEGRLTYYFRHRFTLGAGQTMPPGLALSLQRDDGAVIHLNGAEIHRENMPPGAVDDTTGAASTVGGDDEIAFFESVLPAVAARPLREGVNTLAVEVHQTNGTSTDLHLDLELRAIEEVPASSERVESAVELLRSLRTGDGDATWLEVFAEEIPGEAQETREDVEPRVWFARSRVAHAVGDSERELRSLERASELLAASTNTSDTYARLQLLRMRHDLLLELGRADEAAPILETLRATPPRPSDRPDAELDLGDHYNSPLFDGVAWHGGYWQSLELAPAAWELAARGGVSFDTRGIIQLESGEYEPGSLSANAFLTTASDAFGRQLPERVDGIPVGRTCRTIHAVVGALLVREREPTEIARLVVHFHDGETADLPLVIRENVYGVFGASGTADASIVWTAANPNRRLALASFENPRPEQPIATIDFVSAKVRAAPFLLAITVE